MKFRTMISAAALIGGTVLLSACESSPPDGDAGYGTSDEIVVTGSEASGKERERDTDGAPPPPPPPPPPSPATSAPVMSDTAEAYSESRAEGGVSDSSIPRPAPIPGEPEPKPQPPVQSGLLTAGDYDDLLNPGLYRNYASKFLQNIPSNLTVPDIDVQNAVSVRVLSRNGKPVAGATVTVQDGSDTMFALKTSNAGTVNLFPEFDALPDKLNLEITAKGAGRTRLTLDDIADRKSTTPITVTIDEVTTPSTNFDLLLVIDATGSMADELRYLQAEINSIVDSVEASNPGIDTKVGLIVYRDNGDDYVVRDFDFTSNIADLQKNLNAQSAGGGGNYPEAMDQAMEKALTMGWRENSTKALMLVADAPPHDENLGKTWDTAIRARLDQIHIVPIAASGVGPKAEYMMRAMAAVTQSRYIFLTDDSGVGNPHAEPDVDCYAVTRLDNMVKRVLNGLIQGKRIEPNQSEVIRTVGDYQAGVCDVELDGQERVVPVKTE